MAATRKVVLCADDFGLTDGVSRGILELAESGRISATGAMTNMPGWRRSAQALKPLIGRIGIGLHLNLTVGSPVGPMPILAPDGRFPPLKNLLVKSLTGRLSLSEVRAEIARQFIAFEIVHGEIPTFVDGHQHVHVLPVVRLALLAVLTERGYQGRLWLRDPSEPVRPVLRRSVGRGKALLVGALASGFRARARAAGFPTNDGFSGYAPFDLSVPPERIFSDAFTALGPRPLVMCHPGYVDDELRGLDPAVESRPAELAFLRSEAFDRLLQERAITLTKGVTP
ncbi:ChbG/HpnK family deacetylase [Microvirga brassicacearum]|uniref:ChbG/HpnK family deacetylase n=1 Tax=Microvirga brassicacearum TaxID=2580413 RepID=A0A5N3P6G6_9HYPH|nr:ChbG/HpnK family deacetylase [Microvirga brassicacearum]KAB0265275.1 ChbG/HpnK family deacetylase [Microvirga brassicacearum]